MVTLRDVLAVSCKVLGLYFLVSAVTTSMILFPNLVVFEGVFWRMNVAQSGIVVTNAVGAFLLLRYSERISCLLIREDKPVPDAGAPDWQRALFVLSMRVVGVVVILNAIKEVTVQLGNYGFLRIASLTMPIPASVWSEGLAAVMYLGLGLHLIGGGRLFVRLGERSAAIGGR